MSQLEALIPEECLNTEWEMSWNHLVSSGPFRELQWLHSRFTLCQFLHTLLSCRFNLKGIKLKPTLCTTCDEQSPSVAPHLCVEGATNKQLSVDLHNKTKAMNRYSENSQGRCQLGTTTRLEFWALRAGVCVPKTKRWFHQPPLEFMSV